MRRSRLIMGFAILMASASACHRDDRAEAPAGRGGMLIATAEDPGPDQRFLRDMLSHHQGLTLVTHTAADRLEGPARREAQLIDLRQDVEKDRLTALLRKRFQDSIPPRVDPEEIAAADSLQRLTGPEYTRAFYGWVLQHHRSGVRLIDTYRPLLRDPQVQELADSVRARQTREITQILQLSGPE